MKLGIMRWCGAFAAYCLATGVAHAQSTPPFRLYLQQNSPEPQWRNPINTADLPYRQDCKILASHQLGVYPMAGPHIMEMFPGGRAEYIRQHIERLRQDIDAWFPDPNADGLAMIDYEPWFPYWTTHNNTPSNQPYDALDDDQLDDWRDYIRAFRGELIAGMNADQQEAVFRQTWLDSTRAYWEATILECKRLRPNMKWGVYLLPPRRYYAWSTPEGAAQMRWIDDNELGWLYQAVDVLFPSIYCFYYSVDARPLQDGEDRPAGHRFYVYNNVAEAVRVAGGKPVYPVLWLSYHNSNQRYQGQLLNDINMRQTFTASLDAGASGFVFWDWIVTQTYSNNLQDYARDRLTPFLQQLLAERTPPPGQPDENGDQGATPGGGSGGSGGSGGGSGGGGSGGNGSGGSGGGGSEGGGAGGGGSGGNGSGGSGGGGSEGGGAGGGGAGGNGSGGSGGGGSEGGGAGGNGSGGSGGGGSEGGGAGGNGSGGGGSGGGESGNGSGGNGSGGGGSGGGDAANGSGGNGSGGGSGGGGSGGGGSGGNGSGGGGSNPQDLIGGSGSSGGSSNDSGFHVVGGNSGGVVGSSGNDTSSWIRARVSYSGSAFTGRARLPGFSVIRVDSRGNSNPGGRSSAGSDNGGGRAQVSLGLVRPRVRVEAPSSPPPSNGNDIVRPR